jgi:uncharacterized protein (UPF0276 family)
VTPRPPESPSASAREAQTRTGIEGVGLGLRTRHYGEILETRPAVPWFEVLVDNYAHGEGPPLHYLERIREHYPMVFHGVGMSLGSTDPLDREYLSSVRALAGRIAPAWISEHLAWTSVGGRHFHELLPLPFDDESVRNVAARISEVQDFFGEQILVENSASYMAFERSCLSEAEFVNAVLAEADCALLLDVNNVYVNASNHGFDPVAYLESMPRERVRQMHLAGYDDHGHYLIDAHGSPVSAPVWGLYEQALALFPGVPTCIEWDKDVPPLATLLSEMERAAASSPATR